MSKLIKSKSVIPNFINGRLTMPNTEIKSEIFNPSSGDVIGYTPICGYREVNDAIKSSKVAYKLWSEIPVIKRTDIIFRYRNLIKDNFESLARLITLENGKTFEEAKGDVQRGLEVVEFACGISQLCKGESLSEIAPQIDSVTMREPLGVCVGISPFNFPAMVPMWMFPLAIACGNTFILKPSEKVPMTAIRLAELFHEAGLPEGVFNLVHGGKEVVEILCTHPDIAAISFVGSSKIAKHIYSLGCQNGKRVQAGGGAKNVMLVMPDANPDATIRSVMGSAFGCAGQRCMAGSLLMNVGGNGQDILEGLVMAMNNLKVADTSINDRAEMGPVIDEFSQIRIKKMIEQATKENAILVRDGREGVPKQGFFVGPTLLDIINPEVSVYNEEIFGPVLSILQPKTLAEGINWINRLRFGNGATIFTSNGAAARKFTREVKCGMLGVNVGVPAPMAMYPFSGWNDSFYGDLHMQGIEGVMFYTRQKIMLSRWDGTYHRQQGW